MVMGKNTLMKAALSAANKKPDPTDADYQARKDTYQFNPNIEKIINMLKGNVNIIFSNGDLSEVKGVLDAEVRPSPARPGMIAPEDVWVPAGPTGLDPKQTSTFQTFQIQTKIVKAQIEIVAAKQVVWKDQKIGSTEAALLDKLKIYPFFYKMEVKRVLQDGSLFAPQVLDLSVEAILNKFRNAVQTQAKLSLGAGVPSVASAPHSLLNGFKNLVAVSAQSGFEFAQAKTFLEAAKNAPAAGAAVATTAAAEAAAPVEEKKEEAETVEMGNLFGDDDDDY